MNIEQKSHDDIVYTVLNEKPLKATSAHQGYKFSAPKGMTITKDLEGNNVLVSNQDKYYLYVDLISYYNKEENDYKINEIKDAIYSTTIDQDGKKGYVLITKQNNKYLLEIMYNYAKIEIVTKDIKGALTKSLIILNSMKYNDKVLDTLIGENILTYNEKEYKLLGPKANNDSLEYFEDQEYQDTDNELPDEDTMYIETE